MKQQIEGSQAVAQAVAIVSAGSHGLLSDFSSNAYCRKPISESEGRGGWELPIPQCRIGIWGVECAHRCVSHGSEDLYGYDQPRPIIHGRSRV